MKMKKWYYLFLILAVFAVSMCFSVDVKAENYTIQCGDNAYATLNDVGVLTINGTGDMWNQIDWYWYSDDDDDYYSYSFESNTYEVVIGEGITSIGNKAFYDWNINKVTISSTVKKIGSSAFCYCSSLYSVNIPGNVEEIGDSAFSDTSLNQLVLNNGIKTIESYAFGYTNIKNLVIPQSVSSIKKYAFYSSALNNVTISNGVGLIEEYAFGNNAASYNIQSLNVRIAKGAFPSGSSITAHRGSTAEQAYNDYGKSYNYKFTYACTFGDWKVVTPATCTTAGLRTRICYVCGYPESEEINATGHTFSDWTIVKQVNCTEAGLQSRTCSVCGYAENLEIAATGHTVVKDAAVKATCTTEGKTAGSHCATCGAIIKKQNVIAASHKLKKVSAKKATTKAAGCKAYYKCSVCGKVFSDASGKNTVDLKSLTVAKVSTIKISDLADNGKTQTAKLIVKDSNGKTLKKNKDYSYTFKNKKNGKLKVSTGGLYSVRITFMGDYKGATTVKFKVTPKSTSVDKLRGISGGIKVTWKKQERGTTGYLVQYATNPQFKNATTVKVYGKRTTSTNIYYLKGGKKYYVRVCTYSSSSDVKGKWSAAKTIAIR